MSDSPDIAKKILVVEDEQVIRKLIQRVLGGSYQLTLARGLEEGLDAIRADDFDLLLTDIRLPDGNGIHIIQPYKEKCPQGHVLVMTGSLTPEDRLRQAQACGVTHWIQKPFDVTMFQNAIETTMNSPHD